MNESANLIIDLKKRFLRIFKLFPDSDELFYKSFLSGPTYSESDKYEYLGDILIELFSVFRLTSLKYSTQEFNSILKINYTDKIPEQVLNSCINPTSDVVLKDSLYITFKCKHYFMEKLKYVRNKTYYNFLCSSNLINKINIEEDLGRYFNKLELSNYKYIPSDDIIRRQCPQFDIKQDKKYADVYESTFGRLLIESLNNKDTFIEIINELYNFHIRMSEGQRFTEPKFSSERNDNISIIINNLTCVSISQIRKAFLFNDVIVNVFLSIVDEAESCDINCDVKQFNAKRQLALIPEIGKQVIFLFSYLFSLIYDKKIKVNGVAYNTIKQGIIQDMGLENQETYKLTGYLFYFIVSYYSHDNYTNIGIALKIFLNMFNNDFGKIGYQQGFFTEFVTSCKFECDKEYIDTNQNYINTTNEKINRLLSYKNDISMKK
jgi:hypothetical protein